MTIVDVHAHHTPAEFVAFRRAAAPGGRPPPGMKPPPNPPFEARFAPMAAAGVERQILSAAGGFSFADVSTGVRAARLLNDAFATICHDDPGRFSFWAHLPLPHVPEAVAEAGRALDGLGAAGVFLSCSVLGASIASAEFDPLFAELDRRAAVVLLHPTQNALDSPHLRDWGLTVCAGAAMEDAVAAMHLIVARVPQRYPAITFVVPHLGGVLSVLLDRLDGQLPSRDLAEPPSATARRFYYDTVGWGSKAALLAAVEAFGDTQIVPGSDYPVLTDRETYEQTFQHVRDAGLPQSSVDRILHENAQRLLTLS